MTTKLHSLKPELFLVLNKKSFFLPNLGRDWRGWLISALVGVSCGDLKTGRLARKTQLGLKKFLRSLSPSLHGLSMGHSQLGHLRIAEG